MKTCYIYEILNLKSMRRYVGSTVNIRARWIKHRSLLNCGKHHCQWLQNSWSKNGESAFEFSVIETLPSNDREARTRAELKHILAADCYNNRVSNLQGTNFENSTETRTRISSGIRHAMETNAEYAEFLKERGAAVGSYMKSPEGRSGMSKTMKLRWQNPDERKKLSAGTLRRWNNPEERVRHGAKISAARSTPEMQARISAATKARWDNPNDSIHNRAQTRWADPDSRSRQSEKMRKIWERRRASKGNT